MKVLHVVPSISRHCGGPSEAIREMGRWLSMAGIDVHLATTDGDGASRLTVPLKAPVRVDGLTYWYFPRQAYPYEISFPLMRWLRRHVQDYDLIHIHALFSFSSLQAALCASARGIPYIVTLHGALKSWGMVNRHRLFKRLSFNMIESRILRHAALLHYTSEDERLEAEKLRILTPSAVIYFGFDLDRLNDISRSGIFRSRYHIPQDRKLILFLSRFNPVKGLDLLLPAFADVHEKHPEAILVLAGCGSGRFENRLKNEIREMGIEESVLFTGFLRDELKEASLAESDLFILPSYSESFGISIVEAMAFGLPVIISDRVGIHAEVAKARAGLIIRTDAKDIAGAMMRLLGNEEISMEMGERGRRLIREKFNWEALTKSIISEYENVLNRRGGLNLPYDGGLC